MDRFEALVALNMVPDIGSVRLARLLEYFGEPEQIINAPIDKLNTVFGIGSKIALQLHDFKAGDLKKELALAKRKNVRIMTFEDPDYPVNLKEIYSPPIVLYIKGALRIEDTLSIGIVGSRRASYYGLSNAERFAGELAEAGFTVVSGMARGVDTRAHRGALKRKKRTIAVIGSGFNHLYPEENKELADEIASCGAVVSEFPFESEPLRHHFPRRNRLISGMSLGVLVVEAARNSGALITADFALEQGREVFALPGKVDEATAFGTNALIKQGAKLVSGVEDIIEEFNQSILPYAPPRKRRVVAPRESVLPLEGALDEVMPQEEAAVCHLLDEAPLPMDELVEKTNFDISRISDILLRLQMKKVIKQLPGKVFVKV